MTRFIFFPSFILSFVSRVSINFDTIELDGFVGIFDEMPKIFAQDF